MNIGCITDTHISFKNSNQIFHNYFQKFYENVFFPELIERNIKTVIHLGDAFDNRKGIDYWGLRWAQEHVYDRFKSLGITVYQICGNHDTQLKSTNQHNAIDTLLRDYDNVIPITKPSTYIIDGVEIFFIPWICKDNQEETFRLMQATEAKLAFGHLEVSGFTLFPGQICTTGLDGNLFNKFDRVFSGHFHTRSNNGKLHYLGNPYQMFWGDVNDERGFNIFNLRTYDLEFIKNPHELYKKVHYSDSAIEDYDSAELSGKYLKLVVNKKTNESQYNSLVSKLLELDIIDLKIVNTETYDDTEVDISEIEIEDTLSILHKYIDNSDFSLNKEFVKKVILDVYKEALELEV